MRKLLIILLFIPVSLFATKKYVATNGNDSAAGDIGTPWKSWKKAFATAVAGDTVYFRAGTYHVTSIDSIVIAVNSGTAGSPICYFNYPDEVPILDYTGAVPTASVTRGIQLTNDKNYIHLKGLTICNMTPVTTVYACYGIYVENCDTITIENCVVHDFGGTGFAIYNADKIHVKNCDSYDNVNLTSTPSGSSGTGFTIGTSAVSYGAGMYNVKIYFEGCRSWSNSDNGFSMSGHGYHEFKNCWSFGNGELSGEGIGFKLGWGETNQDTTNKPSRLVQNCIAACNGNYGMSPNNNGGNSYNMYIYNNLFYHNGYKHWLGTWKSTFGVGIVINNYSTAAPDEELYANNISYANEYSNVRALDTYTHNHNSWDIPVNVTDADFVTLDTLLLDDARQSDGSLPDIDFGKLTSISGCINTGVDVGLDYNSTAPDLGWYEYTVEAPPAASTVSTNAVTEPNIHGATCGGIVTYDGGGTVSARGVCWSTSENPTTSDSKTSDGTGTGVFTSTITGLSANTTYHVRAYSNNGVVSYGTDIEFTTPAYSYLQYKDKSVVIQ